jgi:hypothetical protein
MKSARTAVLAAGLLASGASLAADFSFTGTFGQDDEVQLISFNVGAASTVTLRSWGYAGGVNAAGATIARGGFDTILALFDGAGELINSNDDGTGNVAADAQTGQAWDAYLQVPLAAGDYRLSVMQFDNFANGPALADGFFRSGEGNYTAAFDCGAASFCDISGVAPFDQRSPRWAFDVLGVASAGSSVTAVPEPGSVGLLLAGLGLMGFVARRRGGEASVCEPSAVEPSACERT